MKLIPLLTNQRYFKDIVISDQITATTDLAAFRRCGCHPFCRSYKVDPAVAKQVAETLDHPVTVMHASKGLEPGTIGFLKSLKKKSCFSFAVK